MRDPSIKLLADLEQDVFDETKPVAAALRKCVALAARVQAPELRDWALQELKGYQLGDTLPAYRSFPAPLKIDEFTPRGTFTGVMLSLHVVPEPARSQLDRTVDLTDSIDEIEATLKHHANGDEPIRFAPDNVAAIVSFLNQRIMRPYHQITQVYWAVSPATVQGVIGQVRTALTELVAELRSEVGASGSLPPPRRTKELVHDAMPWIAIETSQVTIVAASQNTYTGDVMSDSSKTTITGNKTTIKDNSGTVVAASAHVQATATQGVDVAKVLEFAQYIRQVSPTLHLAEPDQRELESGVAEVEQAAGGPAPDTGRVRRGIERVKAAAGKAAPGLAQKMAITAADDVLVHLAETALHSAGM